jgi:tellurite resistance protein TerC
VGGTVLLVGIAMIVLPGPAFVVIPSGLAILGIEFAWARHWLKKVKAKASDVGRAITGKNKTDPPPPGPPAAP